MRYPIKCVMFNTECFFRANRSIVRNFIFCMQELAKELEKLKKVYADTRKTLEEEMLCRIDMENTVQSLREELSFKDQVFQQELQETRTRRQVEISEIGQYSSKNMF